MLTTSNPGAEVIARCEVGDALAGDRVEHKSSEREQPQQPARHDGRLSGCGALNLSFQPGGQQGEQEYARSAALSSGSLKFRWQDRS